MNLALKPGSLPYRQLRNCAFSFEVASNSSLPYRQLRKTCLSFYQR
ncbi:hypothetical protein L292_1218 [Acinetobacter junii CIP 107470 = MTCC 11364]|uniref:Uncharacterized protein n=1 Tax=Acinetobacter junii CIP 107470 = MTCC 11364 TaxID=1217666 RepID=S7WDL7_ACIJU|nr:hypothetical protein L292_1218 [Acinetobacter junii CIP 107470 = MTCC 11364]